MNKFLDNFIRKAVRADFKKSDKFYVPTLSDANVSTYRVQEYWSSEQNGKTSDVGIVIVWTIIYGAALIALPIGLLGNIDILGNELKAKLIVAGIVLCMWLWLIYRAGIYSGFLRYVYRESRKRK
jgi:hypothetical protein